MTDARERCRYCGAKMEEPCDEPSADVCPKINEWMPLALGRGPATAFAFATAVHDAAAKARRAAAEHYRSGAISADEYDRALRAWVDACAAFDIAHAAAEAAGVSESDHAARPLSPHHR